jgi:methionyl-tRNA formyltransferase
MSFTNILVISDNAYLFNEFKKVIEKINNEKYSFEYAISPFSKPNNFDQLVKIYNLKNIEDVKEIVSIYDLIFSIHCKQIFPIELIKNVKCINIHPGYNPINRGWYPQVFSLLHDLPIGVTIHEIDEKLDHGPIIAREFVEKFDYDTSESLYNRILNKEIELINKYLLKILENNYSVIQPENEGNLYLKKDFNDLLKIDLDKKYSAGELIDKLRALTHGDYSNAYFYDRKTGEKIFVGIKLKRDE